MTPPRASRPTSGRIIAGVAAGVARHVNQPVFVVRIAVVIATLLHGAGIGIYLGLWFFLPLDNTDDNAPPPNRNKSAEALQAAALVLMAAGAVALLQLSGLGVPPQLLLPLAVAAAGIVLVWRQFDNQRDTDAPRTKAPGAVVRITIGMLLVGLAAAYLAGTKSSLSEGVRLFVPVLVALAGMCVVLGPWIMRLISDLAVERRERIRTQERADMAAHLHDSVLQTLALLQHKAEDPASVATLARRQERELREWLYGSSRQDSATVASMLTEMATEIEADYQVVVEVVTVRDAALDDRLSQLLLAAREAMVNAAKHSGSGRIDVYAEIAAETVEVFIRDRGAGFDPDAIPAGRYGVRGSIRGRIHRHQGQADIDSHAGQGTSIRLEMPRAAANGTTEEI